MHPMRTPQPITSSMLHCRAILGRGHPGLMRGNLVWIIPQVQDWLLDLVTCRPVHYPCAMIALHKKRCRSSLASYTYTNSPVSQPFIAEQSRITNSQCYFNIFTRMLYRTCQQNTIYQWNVIQDSRFIINPRIKQTINNPICRQYKCSVWCWLGAYRCQQVKYWLGSVG